jgi:hypothetical protein
VSLLAGASEVDIPPVYFDRPKSARGRTDLVSDVDSTPLKPNPIAQAMEIIARATGSPDKIEKLTLRHPRPVYYVPTRGQNPFVAEFLFSDPESWNESDPFPTRDRSPRYEPPKPDDPRRGTRDAPSRGPFPLGVAVQTSVPAEWLATKPAAVDAGLLTASGLADPATAPTMIAAQTLTPSDRYAQEKQIPLRVAAIGQGEVFTGTELSPAREQLLVNTCNWLLGRDERLPHAEEPAWQFPRVEMSPRRTHLWQLGTLIALPACFAFLGAVVLLVRKYR